MSEKKEVSLLDITHYVDRKVYDDVVSFHAKTIYTSLESIASRCYVSSVPEYKLKKLVGKEVPFFSGIKSRINIERKIEYAESLMRNDSDINFSDHETIDFKTIEQLIENSFGVKGYSENKRSYPSGGALYPIEVCICKLSENIINWPSSANALHYLPLSSCFEEISNENISELFNALAGSDKRRLGSPHFAIVYSIFFEKAIFKYHSRGYRLALLEAGSMYQMADLIGKNLSLTNRVWAGFSDYLVARKLNFDFRCIAPLIIQFFCKREN